MNDRTEDRGVDLEPQGRTDRRVRADALLQSAVVVFETSGVDAPVREIAEKAGVGIGTLYRRFPQRSDLVAAVFGQEVDASADAVPILAAEHEPGEALARWMQRYAAFIAIKRGLASALHSGNPVFDTLPAYFQQRLQPALRTLLEAAAAAGEVRTDIDTEDLLGAVASLCRSAHTDRPDHAVHGCPARRWSALRHESIPEHAIAGAAAPEVANTAIAASSSASIFRCASARTGLNFAVS